MAEREERPEDRSLGSQLVGRHIHETHEKFRGEHRPSEYVAQQEIEECARILAASPATLASLAARHPECRVEAGEVRGFEAVIRTWTLYVLSDLEGG